MNPQRTHANDDGGIDWTKVWDRHVQQRHGGTVEAANDNDHTEEDRGEPTNSGVFLILLLICVVGLSFIGAVQ